MNSTTSNKKEFSEKQFANDIIKDPGERTRERTSRHIYQDIVDDTYIEEM